MRKATSETHRIGPTIWKNALKAGLAAAVDGLFHFVLVHLACKGCIRWAVLAFTILTRAGFSKLLV